jgi:hypothetical protein
MKKYYLLLALLLLFAGSSNSQTWQTQFINTGATTIYDLASNSSPQWIAQDSAYPYYFHVVMMYVPLGDPTTFPNRRTKYYFSSNLGSVWEYIGNVNERKSGFPSIMVASDGAAVICNYGSTSGNTSTRTLIYQDVLAGLGAFILHDPPNNPYFFGKFCLTSDINLPTKFLIMGQGMTSDSTVRITGPTPWSSWTSFANTSPEAYCAARGADGRIGIVYIQNNFSVDDYKSVYFTETTNNGVSFSTPLKIYLANFSSDSLAAFRGLNIAYRGNTPCVVFETVKQDPVSGSYFMKAPAKIMFWSSGLQGSDPYRSIPIAHKGNVPIPPADSIKTGVNDQFGSLSRPVVGVSSDTNTVFVVFQAFTDKWGGTPPDTTNFKALYISKASDNFVFSEPVKFTPDSPLRDWSFPSISAYNKQDESTYYYTAYVTALSDAIPGTYINANGNGQSLAELYFIKIKTGHTINVKKYSEVVPESYVLEQNYPNPFNPITNIKFKIPLCHSGESRNPLVSIKVYDMLGKEVATLVNEQLQPGSYSVRFDAGNLPSGVYFYTLKAGDFSETKRMVYLK